MINLGAAVAADEFAQLAVLTATRKRSKPHIVLVVPRGEAVRNFLYSDTLRILSEGARVTLLSVVDDGEFTEHFAHHAEQILPLREYQPSRLASYVRSLTESAHDRWLWSAVAQNSWKIRDIRAAENGKRIQRGLVKALSRVLANRACLNPLTRLEQYLALRFKTADEFDKLFREIRPDLVFNCSHIHGMAGELPLRVAKGMGIPTAGFIFSWDNLTSRTRIFVPYDYYLVWHGHMRDQLLNIYPEVPPQNVFVTGTPQFDFHFDRKFSLSREELCQRIGIDARRPFILYTTGISNHFFEEHLHVELVIRLLRAMDISPRPQLVVRTYVKGTSPEMKALAARGIQDVVFPPVLWDEKWMTPKREDLAIYTSLLQHASLGINAASTVSLELLMLDKPVINLDFDPPGTDLPPYLGYSRHINFDHYKPVAESGAVMVAKSAEDMRDMLFKGLTEPAADSQRRRALIKAMFDGVEDGRSAARVAAQLLKLAGGGSDV
jgi:hypothetical protein